MSRKRHAFAAAGQSPWKANNLAQTAKLMADPLYDDAFVQAGNYMVYPRKQQVFVRPTAHGLMPLVKVLHDMMCDDCQIYRNTIPLSVFAYYCSLMYWRRVVDACNTKTHTVKTSLIRFRKQMLDAWVMPLPLDKYLSGIGSFRSLTGVPIHIGPEWPSEEVVGGLPGWFGRIGADTHCHYEDFAVVPAAIYSIVACLDAAIPDGQWPQLPHAVCPDVTPFLPMGAADTGRPTENLIGLCRKQTLNEQGTRLLLSCGIRNPSILAQDYSGCFDFEAHILPVNTRLMSAVSELLQRHVHVFDMIPGEDVSSDSSGSLAQSAWVHPVVPNPLCRKPPDPPVSALSNGALTVRVSDKLDGRLVTAAMNFVYRYHKEPTLTEDGECVHTWSCWCWSEYRRLPPGWVDNRNFNFDYDLRASFINFHGFDTQVYSLNNSLRHLCRVLQSKAKDTQAQRQRGLVDRETGESPKPQQQQQQSNGAAAAKTGRTAAVEGSSSPHPPAAVEQVIADIRA